MTLMVPVNVRLKPGETALFGYGSLISIASLEKTLKRKYTGPFLVCELNGWRRGWDVFMPNDGIPPPEHRAAANYPIFYEESPSGRMYPENILYLNVRRMSGSIINGVLFVVGHEELLGFDERESIYDREDITKHLQDVNVEGGSAWVYHAKPKYVMTNVASPAQAAVRTTYLAHLEAGFRDLGQDFRARFEASSDPVPQHLVIADKK